MLLVWFLGLTFAIPLYHPYPRLALPWLMAVWLGAGGLLGWLAGRAALAKRSRTRQSADGAASSPHSAECGYGGSGWPMAAAGALFLFAAIALWVAKPEPAAGVHSAWQARTGLRTAAEKIVHDVASPVRGGESTIVFVYAEPALVFHLNAVQLGAKNRAVVAPVGDLDFGEIPLENRVFLAAGLHAGQSADFHNQVNKSLDRFVLMKEYPYHASDIVLSDHYSPADWEKYRNQAVKLYRVN
jgi:hypothetical protein